MNASLCGFERSQMKSLMLAQIPRPLGPANDHPTVRAGLHNLKKYP